MQGMSRSRGRYYFSLVRMTVTFCLFFESLLVTLRRLIQTKEKLLLHTIGENCLYILLPFSFSME